jgi:ABC-2 type transport system permease protein
MNVSAALWAEALKMRRSKVPLYTAVGLSLAPLVDGMFMVILKDPEAARSMGLISSKAQLIAGVADWPTFFNVLGQAVAVGGAVVFAIITAWVFGREFSDHTAKELLALPTPRESIVAAKFAAIAVLTLGLTILIFLIGLVVGVLVDIPGWSQALFQSAAIDVLGAGVLTIVLLPFVALFAGIGHGELPPMGWTVLTVALAQIAAITGWGDWFPWSIPALFSGAAGPRAELLGPHSYLILCAASLAGLVLTFRWWRNTDHTR